jgi:DNA-binding PadR family transcriptional regulator
MRDMIKDDTLDGYQPHFDNLALELRRGVLVLAVLSQLRQEQYGYSLMQSLTEAGLEINEGTLYPLLRRLEGQGLLQSQWHVEDGQRPRRYYQLSHTGRQVLDALQKNWQTLVLVLDQLFAKQEATNERSTMD